jgi:glyoxylase-like metal-dependent hydrolase (beta-lactamase superfamily II)
MAELAAWRNGGRRAVFSDLSVMSLYWPGQIDLANAIKGTDMNAGFASTADLAEKKIAFEAIGPGLYAFTAEGDPNSGVIVGDDAVMVVDAQATPMLASEVIRRVASITDKPIKYVLLTHYHAVRVLGASAYAGAEILASDATRDLIVERGKQDMDSEIGRFPRLFRAAETIPGLTWPSVTFPDQMSVWLGRREVRLMQIGRGHTAGDTVAWVPDADVVFSGDLVEYRSACYCGDAHFTDWPATLDRLAEFKAKALVPGRGAALKTPQTVAEGIELTADFLTTLYGSVSDSVAQGRSLKAAFDAARVAMDPKFSSFPIYEHCLPFNVSRAYDEARGIDRPVIWTAERDREMWAALQG